MVAASSTSSSSLQHDAYLPMCQHPHRGGRASPAMVLVPSGEACAVAAAAHHDADHDADHAAVDSPPLTPLAPALADLISMSLAGSTPRRLSVSGNGPLTPSTATMSPPPPWHQPHHQPPPTTAPLPLLPRPKRRWSAPGGPECDDADEGAACMMMMAPPRTLQQVGGA